MIICLDTSATSLRIRLISTGRHALHETGNRPHARASHRTHYSGFVVNTTRMRRIADAGKSRFRRMFMGPKKASSLWPRDDSETGTNGQFPAVKMRRKELLVNKPPFQLVKPLSNAPFRPCLVVIDHACLPQNV